MSLQRYVRPVPSARNEVTYGQYGAAARTGVIAAGITNDAELLQFRWNPVDASKRAHIRKVLVDAAVSTTYFAAGIPVQLELLKCTGWSAAGSGGAAVDPGAANRRGPSTMKATEVVAGDFRIATTAGLTAGTKTIATPALGFQLSGAPITASLSGQILPPNTPLFEADLSKGEHPLELVAAEGFIVRCRAPATGVWACTFRVEWDESDYFPYGTNH
jgi:hypothetical protein